MNRILIFSFFSLMTVLSFFPEDIEALGGRENDFRGNADDRSGRALEMNHSPSMSRSEPRNINNLNFQNPNYDVKSVARPQSEHYWNGNVKQNRYQNNANIYQNRREDNRPYYENRSFENTNIQRRNLDQNNVNIQNYDNKSINLQQDSYNKQNFQNQRNNVNTLGNRGNWFTESYWENHPNKWYRDANDTNWWRAATWRTFASWLPWKWGNPVYYTFGPGGNIYYSNDNVYYNGEIIATGEEYIEQAEDILAKAPEIDVESVEWLPLGVFALSGKDNSGREPTMFLQIAVSKEGFISGTYINTANNTVLPIEGVVDEESQRAVWKVNSSQGEVIMETGAYNLTQKQTGLFIHFPGSITQTWLMVRINQSN